MLRKAMLSAMALVLLGCGPLVTLPGGALSGSVQASPSDWSFSDEVDTVQLETNPDDPYSVNVWGVAVGARFYVAAADDSRTWARHMLADPRVRLRIGDALYELQAVRTEDADEREAFLLAAKSKYDFEPEPEQSANAVLFRLDPR